MGITRRDFVKTSVAAGVGVAVWPGLAAAAQGPEAAASGPLDRRVLVVVQMAGGNDGLNTVVPYNDGRYYDFRPGLALEPDEMLPIDDERALHQGLAPLKELWDEGRLAIVEGVGYPNPSFSHFQSMDIWHSASPDGARLDGWLGRYFERFGGDAMGSFPGLAIGSRLPGELMTPYVNVPIVQNVRNYRLIDDGLRDLVADMRLKALFGLNEVHRRWSRYGPLLDNTLHAAEQSSVQLAEAEEAYQSSVEYPDTRIGRDLELIAAAIDGGLGPRVAHVSIGSFDTHASQRPTHERLLSELSQAVSAFYRDLQAKGSDQDVVIMTWSEFGRRARANASGGTDHGWATPVFLAGTPVRGGRYGEHPDLGRLDRDNLVYTTDFRSVYATVLEDWLAVPHQEVIDGSFETLPLFAASGS